ncbi:MAG: class A beta-lactamase-related serine hydrolase, partial [Hymenobacter sp.]
MLPRLSLTALLSLAALGASAQTLNTAKLDSLLNSLATNHKLMGSLALTRAGQVVYSHAFGDAQVTPSIAATPATRYRVGSISKMFTAVMIFQLIEERKLTLETPLATFFPQLPNASRITIDQLLSHRSGLHNFTSDAAYQGYMAQPKTQAELLAIIAQTTPDFEPGAKAAYS